MQHRFFLFIVLLCAVVPFAWAEGIPVMRFVPVAGEESEVVLNTLRKVVFTPDSVVLIAAKDGAQTPMYKYDYQAIVFSESTNLGIEGVQRTDRFSDSVLKFIKDGQLYIRLDDIIYDILGNKIK